MNKAPEAAAGLRVVRASGQAANELPVGARMREARKAKGWSLARLSEISGIPLSTLSKFENGSLSLPLDRIFRLSDSLGIGMSDMFDAGPAVSPDMPGRRSILRAGEGRQTATASYDRRWLFSDLMQKRMFPVMQTVLARDMHEFGPLSRHEGEEFSIVIKGRVQFVTEIYEPVILGEMDGIYIDSRMAHAYLNVGPGEAVILNVSTVAHQYAADDEANLPFKNADLRSSEIWQAVRAWYADLLAPGTDAVVRIAKPACDPASGDIVVAGLSYAGLSGAGSWKLYRATRQDTGLERITGGPGQDLDPVFGPSGRQLAFRSNRVTGEGFEACVLDTACGEMRRSPALRGSVEALAWMDDERLLLLVADPDTISPGIQGALPSMQVPDARPGWFPTIDDGSTEPKRTLWIWSPGQRVIRDVAGTTNVWDMAPCCAGHALVVGSDGAEEDDWYQADLRLVDLVTGEAKVLHASDRRIGAPSADPTGTTVAFVEGLASDRGSLVGTLMLIDLATGAVRAIDTHGVDVSWTGWRGDTLFAAGIIGDTSVFLRINVATGIGSIVSRIAATNAGVRYPEFAPLRRNGDAVLGAAVLHSLDAPDRLALIGEDRVDIAVGLDAPGIAKAIDEYGPERFVPISWTAADGVALEGWVHTPLGPGPFPLVTMIHGGPTARWHPRGIAEMAQGVTLARLGIAQFYPNPRGSTGHGQAFAETVLHDIGGREATDILTGIDALVERGVADPERLGVTGSSHGGFMTSWLITQDQRFKAAVAVAPITDWASQKLTTTIPSFNTQYVGNPAQGLPSPISFVDRVTTPVLIIAGRQDRVAPASQAEQLHNALRQANKASTLVIYPEEGHGIRAFPAMIDHVARIAGFFEKHLK